jgi:Cdc6-like AAA superfamily ATPase
MTTQPQHVKRPQLLADVPSDEDKFQSHQKIADALSEVIEGQPGGKTIGLEGSWGSGKSTIIRLFSKAVSKTQNRRPVLMFNFDAWAHQGDPLRRAFLEGLIDQCLTMKWVGDLAEPKNGSNQDWEDEKARLARRMKESTKLTVPVLTTMGKALLPSLLLLPVGSALIGGAFKDKIHVWPLVVGLLLSSAPLLVLFWFWYKTKGNKAERQRLLAVFYQKASTEETTKTVETSEPTTLEFQNVFSKLLSAALTNTERRVVVVLDNLDRISTQESVGVWAMLRSFIDNPLFSKEAWFKQIWVLIPYAPDGLATEQSAAAAQPREHFLEKVIQIKFYVPSPVLSNWKQYLTELLHAAFPEDQDSNAFHKIYLLCASELSNAGPPGPRELVTLVNDIVATELQWQGKIPLEHQALYAILKRNRTKIQEGLIARSLPTAKQTAILGPTLGDSLAALTFNVDTENATQILLKPRIKEVLLEPFGKSLMDEYLSRPGFAELFDVEFSDVLSEYFESELSSILKCILSVHKSGILASAKIDSQREIRREIGRAIRDLPYWPLQDNLVLESLQAVMLIDTEGLIREALGDSLKKTSGWFLIKENAGFLPKETNDFKPILQTISSIWSNQQLRDYFEGVWPMPPLVIPGDPARWIEVCDFMQTSTPRLELAAIRSETPTAKIFSYLKQQFDTSAATGTTYNTLHHYLDVGDVEHFGPVISSISPRLSSESFTDADEILNVYKFLLKASSVLPGAATVLKQNIESGWMLHNLWVAFSSNRDDVIAWLLFVWLREDPAGTLKTSVGHAAEGHAFAIAFFKSPTSRPGVATTLGTLARRFDADDLIFRMDTAKGPSAPLAAYFASEASEKNDVSALVGPTDVARRVTFVLRAMQAAQKDVGPVVLFLKERVEGVEFVAEITNAMFDPNQLIFYKFLLDNTSIRTNLAFVRWCQQALLGVSREDLVKDLAADGPWSKLIIDLAEGAVPLKLGSHYRDALKEFSSQLLAGTAQPDGNLRASRMLLAALTPELLDGLTDELYELAAMNSGRVIAEGFFLFVGDTLISRSVLSNSSNKAIRRLILPLVDHVNVAGLTWVVKAIEKDAEAIKNADDAAVRDLFDKLRIALKVNARPDVMQRIFEQVQELRPEIKFEENTEAGSVTQSDE